MIADTSPYVGHRGTKPKRKPFRSYPQALQLFDENLWSIHPFMKGIVHHIPFTGVFDLDDVANWAREGLWHASLYWNPNGGSTFKSYSAVLMRGSVLDTVRKIDQIPRTVREKMKTPSKESAECIEAWAFSNPVRIDDPLGDDEGETHGSMIADSTDLHHFGEVTERRQLLQRALLELNEQELAIVKRYYWDDIRGEKIGRENKISRTRVFQILDSAKDKLRNHLVEVGI
jgi:RNA polymerase sigma factor FliA